MSLVLAAGLFVLGLGLVVVSAETLVESTVGLSRQRRLSAFLISVVFIGFDAENLAVGVTANYDAAAGIALGTIVGAAMVALALALGVTAVIAPLHFREVPRRILLLPAGAVLLLMGLAIDGHLSRIDGALLLLGSVGGIAALVYWERRGVQITLPETVEDDIDEEGLSGIWRSTAWFVASLVGVLVGSEGLLRGARPIIDALGWTDTAFGMTVLALLVSVEEVARELPAALKGRPDLSFGNVVGSALAFFCFNAGVIALVRPLPVKGRTLHFYLPVCAGTVLLIAGLMARGRITRWGGVLLLLAYGLFVAGPFVV